MPGEEGLEVKSAQVCAGLYKQEASADSVPRFLLFDQELVNGTSMQCIVSLALYDWCWNGAWRYPRGCNV